MPCNKQDIKVFDKGIRYIKSVAGLHKKSEGLYGSFLYYFLIAIGPLLFLFAFLFRKWHLKSTNDLVKVRSRKANRIAAKHLANAKKQLMTGNTSVFYEDVFKGIYGYLSDKLNIPSAKLNKETIIAQLKARSVDDMLIRELMDTLDICEMARFAPAAGISEQEVFDKSKRIIDDIE